MFEFFCILQCKSEIRYGLNRMRALSFAKNLRAELNYFLGSLHVRLAFVYCAARRSVTSITKTRSALFVKEHAVHKETQKPFFLGGGVSQDY